MSFTIRSTYRVYLGDETAEDFAFTSSESDKQVEIEVLDDHRVDLTWEDVNHMPDHRSDAQRLAREIVEAAGGTFEADDVVFLEIDVCPISEGYYTQTARRDAASFSVSFEDPTALDYWKFRGEVSGYFAEINPFRQSLDVVAFNLGSAAKVDPVAVAERIATSLHTSVGGITPSGLSPSAVTIREN